MARPTSADFDKTLAELARIDSGNFGAFGLVKRRPVDPIDMIIEDRLNHAGRKVLSLGLKYYELLAPGQTAITADDVEKVDESFKEIAERNLSEPFGNFGWIIARDGSRRFLDSDVPTRVLRVYVWDNDSPGDFSTRVFEYIRGRRDQSQIPDKNFFCGEEISIASYERMVWRKFLDSDMTKDDAIAYLANFYSTAIEPAR